MVMYEKLTRRSLWALAGVGFAAWRQALAASADFWNRKDAAEWTPEEVQKLLTKSPWARQVHAESSKTIKDPAAVTDPTMPGASYPGYGKRGNMGMGNPRKPGKTPSSKMITTYTGAVLWESAKPVRDALKTALPDDFNGLYVLSLSGVPLKSKALTTLRVKGKDPAMPAVVQPQNGNGAVYLFGFSKEGIAIAKDDKEVVFETHMGKLVFTAKFTPKEMLYKGELAL